MKEGWKIQKLGEFADSFIGLTYKPDDISNKGTVVLRSNNIQNFRLDLNDIVRVQTHINDSKIVKNGDILMCSRNGSFSLLGKTAIIPDLPEPMSFGAFMTIIRSPFNAFLFFFFRSSTFRKNLMMGKTSTVNQITVKMLQNMQIPVPPLSEQQQIVEELDLLSSIIEKKKEQLKELDNLAQSIFYEMFGDPVTNEKRWEKTKISSHFEVNPKKAQHIATLSDDDVVSFLPMEDLEIGNVHFEAKQSKVLNDVNSSYTFFTENDLLLAKVTPCFENGKVSILHNLSNKIGFGSSEFHVFRQKGSINCEFLYFIFRDRTFIESASKSLTGTSGLRRVPRKFVEDYQIPVPPLPLQQSFASKIEAIEKQKALIKQSITETETLFNSRMDYYFG